MCVPLLLAAANASEPLFSTPPIPTTTPVDTHEHRSCQISFNLRRSNQRSSPHPAVQPTQLQHPLAHSAPTIKMHRLSARASYHSNGAPSRMLLSAGRLLSTQPPPRQAPAAAATAAVGAPPSPPFSTLVEMQDKCVCAANECFLMADSTPLFSVFAWLIIVSPIPNARRVCKEHAHRPFLGYKPPGSDPNRAYQWVTYGEFGGMVDRARALLHHSGIGKGDTVRCTWVGWGGVGWFDRLKTPTWTGFL
jgi:hypothetical protein